MLTVAVTGGIGAGKSTVARHLADRGAIVIDSDRLAREVVEPGTDGLSEVVREFGRDVLMPDGCLDRAALAAIVFGDDEARRRLEGIIHPRVRAAFRTACDAAPDEAVVVNDIPLLRTAAEAAAFDRVVVVTAPEEVRLARLVGRGLAADDARARIRAQISDAQRNALADVVIDNSGGTAALGEVLDGLWSDLRAAARRRRPAVGGAS